MPRPMTPQEKQQFSQSYPNLNVNAAVVTGEASRVYNCLAWTLGITNAWIWPGYKIEDFDALYYDHCDYVRSDSGPIAAWGHSETHMTHGSVSGPGHGPRWESKCGDWARIQHDLNELVSNSYGQVLAFYDRGWLYLFWRLLRWIRALAKRVTMPARISETAQARLDGAVREMEPDLRMRFERLFDAWRESWNAPEIAIQSDPAAVRTSPLFPELVQLGPQILPAVAKKLADPENFLALQLYDALQPQANLVVLIDPRSEEMFEGEQGRAIRTVERYARSLVGTTQPGAPI